MERWQKIERCLSEFFRDQLFVYQQGDTFAKISDPEDDDGNDCDHEFNLTALAKEIDSDLGYNKKEDLSGCINEGFAAIRERVTSGGPGWERKK